jgi:hypothetical protein
VSRKSADRPHRPPSAVLGDPDATASPLPRSFARRQRLARRGHRVGGVDAGVVNAPAGLPFPDRPRFLDLCRRNAEPCSRTSSWLVRRRCHQTLPARRRRNASILVAAHCATTVGLFNCRRGNRPDLKGFSAPETAAFISPQIGLSRRDSTPSNGDGLPADESSVRAVRRRALAADPIVGHFLRPLGPSAYRAAPRSTTSSESRTSARTEPDDTICRCFGASLTPSMAGATL